MLLRRMSLSRSRVFPGVCTKAHEGVFQGAPRGGAYTSPPMKSKAKPHVDPHDTTDNPLGYLLDLGNDFIKTIYPDWNPPVQTHPHAIQYASVDELIPNIVSGDQIMVTSDIDRSAYWHHGIFIVKENDHGVKTSSVVDVWGINKAEATISIRKFSDFTNGAKGLQRPSIHLAPHCRKKCLSRSRLPWWRSPKSKALSTMR